MDRPDYLPISALAEFHYCPRNFYYRVVEGATETNQHIVQGWIEAETREARKANTNGESHQQRGVMLSSERLGLIGIVDALEECGDLYPVEYKKGELRENPHDQIQLCAQGMLLEDVTGRPVRRGFLYYGESHQRLEVPLTEDLRDLVLHTIEQARALIDAAEIPNPVNDGRCAGCALQGRCMPAEVGFLKQGGAAPGKVLAGVNFGRVLYVDEPGAYLRKSGERLVVTKDQATLHSVPVINLDEVVLVGQVNLSTSAAKLCLERDLPVSYLTPWGAYEGRMQPAFSKAAPVRIAQVAAHLDPVRSLAFAKAFVVGKLTNQRTLLMRYRRGAEEELGPLDAAVNALADLIKRAAGASDKLTLLGLEGMGGRHYFGVFERMLKAGMGFNFERRTRRPPEDPVNALLSFAYALLIKEMATALSLANLDPYVGFLHESKWGKPAGALDLMEEFRPIVADSVVLSLVNKGIIGPEEFERPLQGCFLTTAARKRFYQEWERRKGEEITHPLFGYKVTYRRVFEVQARLLAKAIQGDVERYQPLLVR